MPRLEQVDAARGAHRAEVGERRHRSAGAARTPAPGWPPGHGPATRPRSVGGRRARGRPSRRAPAAVTTSSCARIERSVGVHEAHDIGRRRLQARRRTRRRSRAAARARPRRRGPRRPPPWRRSSRCPRRSARCPGRSAPAAPAAPWPRRGPAGSRRSCDGRHRQPAKRYTAARITVRVASRRWPPTHAAELAVIGGSGLYTLLDDVEQVDVDTPYGPPSGPIAIGTIDAAERSPVGGLRRPPRPRPSACPAHDQLPGQRVGAALARRHPGARPVRVGLAARRGPTRRRRRLRPVRRRHVGSTGHVLRRPGGEPRVDRRPVLPAARRAGRRRSRARRVRRPSVRHGGGHPRPALRHPRRIGDLPPARATT